MKIDFSQPSTIRGVIWLIIGLASIAAYFAGKDMGPLLSLGAAITGAMGVAMDDRAGLK